MVVVHHVFRPDAVFQVLEVGAQLLAHASALGKAMLAFAPDAVIDDGPARGLGPAVTEAARSVSRELGAGRWTGA